ncbi:MAG: ABC transporter permease [Acidobacteriia bacterium]|nr:ABC transporter permease [Terriglobia bacterium]
MKIRAIAQNTFSTLVRDKLLIVFAVIFLCVLLLMIGSLTVMKTAAATDPSVLQSTELPLIGGIMSLVSGLGSLLAVWASADSLWSELKSGTILAVMARPVRRWEFLLGKFLGVQWLMAIYVLFLLVMSYLLAWIGGARIQSTPWVLIVYPMVRYAIYSAFSLLLATVLHPVVTLGIVVVNAVVTDMVGPDGNARFLPDWLRSAVYAALPSTGLLSESRFLTITEAKLKQIPWTEHAIALAYGLDCALVFLLLAMWAFRRRGLVRN